jgi:hypothetical protein
MRYKLDPLSIKEADKYRKRLFRTLEVTLDRYNWLIRDMTKYKAVEGLKPLILREKPEISNIDEALKRG